MLKKWKAFWPVGLLPVLLFAGLWLFGETGIYNDSQQYIAMHIHREPCYSFFLWICRSLFGEANYLEIVRFLQNLLAAFSVIYISSYLRKTFRLNSFGTLLVCLLQLSPHIITPLFAASGLVLTNGIMSEAVGLPLFYFFEVQCLKLFFGQEKWAWLRALLLALLLSLVRGQMMMTILLWAVVAVGRAFLGPVQDSAAESRGPVGQTAGRQRHTGAVKKLLVIGLAAALTFCGRSFIVRSYNLAFNGHFINNTFGGVGLLANVLYAADREDGEKIADEQARAFFYQSYDLALEKGATWQQAPEGFLNRAAHLEKWHDEIKFRMIEEPWRAYHDIYGPKDYIPENQESDRVAGIITGSILPACLDVWLYDYLALAVYGLIRSVAFIHPVFNWYALFLFLLAAVLCAHAFWKKKNIQAAWLMAFALLALFANVFATAMLIMCLSRYMIYCLPLFYTALFLLLTGQMGKWARLFQKERQENS